MVVLIALEIWIGVSLKKKNHMKGVTSIRVGGSIFFPNAAHFSSLPISPLPDRHRCSYTYTRPPVTHFCYPFWPEVESRTKARNILQVSRNQGKEDIFTFAIPWFANQLHSHPCAVSQSLFFSSPCSLLTPKLAITTKWYHFGDYWEQNGGKLY